MFVHTPRGFTRFFVYYQYEGVSYNTSFILSEENSKIYQLANFPPERVHSIYLVAMNQAESNVFYLPSLLAGPVDPGMLFLNPLY